MFTPLIFDAISSPTCVARLLGVVAFAGPGETWTLTVDRDGFPLRLDPGLRRRAPKRRDHLLLFVHVVHSIAVAPPSVLRTRPPVSAAAGGLARGARGAGRPGPSAGARVQRGAARDHVGHHLDEIVLAPDGTWSRRHESPSGGWAPAPFWRVVSGRRSGDA